MASRSQGDAYDRALKTVRILRPEVPGLVEVQPAQGGCAFYRTQALRPPLFIKLQVKGDSERLHKERQVAQWAGAMGWGPQALLVPPAARAVVTAYTPSEPLMFAHVQTYVVRCAVIELLQAVHTPAPAHLTLPKLAYTFGGLNAWARRASRSQLFKRQQLLPLQERMAWVKQELQRVRAPASLLHADPLRRNMLWQPPHLILVDWEHACVGDPLWDLAKFFGYNHAPQDDYPVILQHYLTRVPTSDETRRFTLLLMAHSMDHYAYKLLVTPPNPKSVARKHTHLVALDALVKDLPNNLRLTPSMGAP